MKKIYLNEVELEELLNCFRLVVKEEVARVMTENLNERFLTIDEVRKLFAPPISRPTITRLRDEGTLTEYRLPPINKPMFKYREVLQAFKQIKKFSNRINIQK